MKIRIVVRRYEILLLIVMSLLFVNYEVFSKCSVIDPRLLPPVSLPVMAKPKSIAKEAKPKTKYIALTFDDGPHPEYTEQMLNILKKENVKATFFLVGQMVELYPNLTQLIIDEGHQVGNHTYSHPNLKQINEAQLAHELNYTKELIISFTGYKTDLIRPPGGNYNENILNFCQNNGYHIVLWTIFPRDHESPKQSTLCKRILKQAHNDGIILLHSGVKTTVDALPEIIKQLRANGYRFLTVDKLVTRENGQTKPKIKYQKVSFTSHLSPDTCLNTTWYIPPTTN